ncbi:AMP-binding protein [Qipengyuania atrilutea]|nr:AMP-binding protein [Actirhodobacter atriluteus]
MNIHAFAGTANNARFLLSEKATGTSSALPVTYEISGPLNLEKLADAVEAVILANPMLRAESTLENGSNVTITVFSDAAPLVIHDLSGREAADVEPAIREFIGREIKAAGTRFRATIVKVSQKRFFLTCIFHHSLIDGVSIGLFFDTLAKVYNSNSSLDALFSDADLNFQNVCNETRNAEALRADADGAYWSELLANNDTPSPIASALAEEYDDRLQTGCVQRFITDSEHDAIRQRARKIGVRTFSLYLTLGQSVLQRMTGQNDVIVSMQSAGRRNFEGNSNTIGLYSRALVIRAGDKPAVNLAERARLADAQVDGALVHEMTPYQDILGHMEGTPRFAFNWYPVQEPLSFAGCSCEERIIYPWQTTFDLNFHFVRIPGGVDFRLFFNRAHCDERAANVVADQLHHLVQTAPTTPDEANLPTLGGPLSGTVVTDLMTGRIEEVFRQCAANCAEKTAIHSFDRCVSYRELTDEVTNVAAALSEQKVKAPRVMVVGERGPGLVVAALAALKAGGSFAIVDAAYPEGRIAQFHQKLVPDFVVFCDNADSDFLQTTDCSYERIDWVPSSDIAAIMARTSHAELPGSENVAYWLFTSGSTGEPKCVSSDHAPLLNAISWQRSTFGIREADKTSFLSGVSHDPSLRDIFLPLLTGGELHIPDPAKILEPGYVRDWLKEQRVTVAHLTPAMTQVIGAGRNVSATLPHLRLLFVGGERASTKARQELRELAPHAALINVYGATETPQIVLYKDITERCETLRSERAIGYPRADVTAEVRGRDNRLCGYFEPGEIAIVSPFLSNGYNFGETDKTSPFDFAESTGKPLSYRTGDVGYVDDAEGIVLLGRADDQIKIRGYRVEPGEVTAQLRALVGHDEAVVLAVPHQNAHRLIAYIADTPATDIEHLRSRLRDKLPPYMMPEGYVAVAELPKLRNGKIDRTALFSITAELDQGSQTVVAPATASERQLVEVWERVLGVSPISVNESLFDLGGDSLTGVMLMVELEREGLDENVARSILAGATIREIARKTDEGSPPEEAKPLSFEPGPLLSRTAIHMARGLLVILIIAGHWFPGVAERIAFFASIKPILTPVFNLSTPGFAIIFGISFGYFNFETYQTRKAIFNRQLRLGAIFLFIAMLFISANLGIGRYLDDRGPTLAFLISSLYSVIGFYLLALISLPWWFGYFNKFGFTRRSLAVILAGFIVMDQITQYLFPYDLPDGPLQLLRNYVAAKFSYFSLGIGAIAGIYMGHKLRESPRLPLRSEFLIASTSFMVLGVVWGYFLGDLPELERGSQRIDYWKWLLYFGASMALVSGLWFFLTSKLVGVGIVDWIIKLVASIGSLALFFFVFHGFVQGLKGIFDSLGSSDIVGLLLALVIFGAISAFGIRKMWRLYF